MFKAQHIDHVEVLVSDLPRSAKWYEEVLGLKPMGKWDPEPWMIGAGTSKLALFKAELPRTDAGSEAHWHRVAWHTDAAGFQGAQQHLKALGIAFRGPVDHGVSDSIYFNDPDGNPLEITFYKR
ncbi:Glyoxalase/bleomycin resistance protein/dioxygenase [Candidatus Koribacter versatilis Ellin345]|uniref:Glyoxalase/bleomycin resistance protein/dioxygenase n=1 Tax=Koribacter versatilis (strain Ellin345) TaxID=204669 RepID=Q1IS23_KORVE|nr:VOC family protein [Candidatus Koribacter versatilis]ABF40327.1 Glyoxalase/bleomycin resistance protein/dioxygenase [Candidatus Koribacter versatilis Ellin345]